MGRPSFLPVREQKPLADHIRMSFSIANSHGLSIYLSSSSSSYSISPCVVRLASPVRSFGTNAITAAKHELPPHCGTCTAVNIALGYTDKRWRREKWNVKWQVVVFVEIFAFASLRATKYKNRWREMGTGGRKEGTGR